VAQMAFAEYDDKINAFSADRTDQPILHKHFAKVSGLKSGGLECQSIEPGGRIFHHKLRLDPESDSEGFAPNRRLQ
jgi:hypothetical protein